MSGFPELTPVQKICNTSVDDATQSIRTATDIKLLKECLAYEVKKYNRATMLKMLSARIRHLEKCSK